ncbi:MAG: 30S ribosomal protein S6 [Phycisphaerales bacterium]|nr:30S ribosomal protein S6 [Phycisphaerales bacterium]
MTATETRTGTYEAMFLVNQTAAAAFGECLEHINHLFERAEATVIAMKKWDERRLSYEMDKQKRGVYILAYFTCPTNMVAHLERDAVISDKIMRLMVTSAEHLTEEEIAAHDDRKGLETEAKFKAEQGDTADSAKSSTVRLGAPVQAAPAPKAEEAPAEESAPEADSDAPAAE